MKKTLFLLTFLLSALSLGENFSISEKKQILTQYKAFQKAVNKKDTKVLESITKIQGIDEDEILKDLKDVTLIKTNTDKLTVKTYRGKKNQCAYEVKADFIENDDFTNTKSFRVMSGPFYIEHETDKGCLEYRYYYFRMNENNLTLDEIMYYSG